MGVRRHEAEQSGGEVSTRRQRTGCVSVGGGFERSHSYSKPAVLRAVWGWGWVGSVSGKRGAGAGSPGVFASARRRRGPAGGQRGPGRVCATNHSIAGDDNVEAVGESSAVEAEAVRPLHLHRGCAVGVNLVEGGGGWCWRRVAAAERRGWGIERKGEGNVGGENVCVLNVCLVCA